MEFIFIFKGVVIVLILGGWYAIKKWNAKRDAIKNKSLIALLKRRAMDEAEECEDGLTFSISKDKKYAHCKFPLETIKVYEDESVSRLTLLEAIKIPMKDEPFIQNLLNDPALRPDGIEYQVEGIDESGFYISVTVDTEIDFSDNPMGHL